MNCQEELPKTKIVDLFCGIGGMTHGFHQQGLNVVAGVDIDDSCRFGYEINNKTKFIHKNINNFSSEELLSLYADAEIKVLVGCAPCQPYSRLNKNQGKKRDKTPLEKFADLIEETQPDIVSMENVRGLSNIQKYPEFDNFLSTLKKNNYKTDYRVVDASNYGVPQRRYRLVLLASKLGEITLIKPTHTHQKQKVTVRDTISHLPSVKDGQTLRSDPLHWTRKLGVLNKKRIRSTPKDGGNSTSWESSLLPECYKKKSGHTYRRSVYGRMRWDEPSPTMTTQCIGLGNGRFGHPEQDRAITLREAALLQTFPHNYRFVADEFDYNVGDVARFIGNAVPVKLGSIIAQTIRNHIEMHGTKN